MPAAAPIEQQQTQQRPASPAADAPDTVAALAARLPPLPAAFPPLPPLALPQYQQLTLSNGLRVFLLEDHELPVVRGSMLIKGGQRASPADKVRCWPCARQYCRLAASVTSSCWLGPLQACCERILACISLICFQCLLLQVGLATLSAAVQRSGGSRQHPAAALEEALEERAASIEGGAGGEAFGFGFSCLREDAPDVMQLFAEVRRWCCLWGGWTGVRGWQLLGADGWVGAVGWLAWGMNQAALILTLHCRCRCRRLRVPCAPSPCPAAGGAAAGDPPRQA
jgi:hypothetical protein